MKSNSRVLRGWRDFGVKATAIILTILLATQMVGTPAFASGALTNKQASEDIATTVDDTGVEPSGTEATDTTVPDEAAGAANEPAPADSTQATEEPVVETVESATEPATETPAADPAATAVLGTEPEPASDSGSEPAPAVEQDQLASIKLNLADGASITLSKDGNKIDDDTNPVDVPANEELKFTAAAPEGMQISAVKTFINDVESDPIAADENGEYTIAAEDVTDELTVKVEMSAVEGETPSEGEEASTEDAAETGDEESTDPAAVEGENVTEEGVTPESIADTATNAVKTMVSEISLFAAGEDDTVTVTVRKVNEPAYSKTVELPLGRISEGVIEDAIAGLSEDLESYSYRDVRVGDYAINSIKQVAGITYVMVSEDQIAGIRVDDTKDIVIWFEPYVETFDVNYTVRLDGQSIDLDEIPGELTIPSTVRQGDTLSIGFTPSDNWHNVDSITNGGWEAQEQNGLYVFDNIQAEPDIVINLESDNSSQYDLVFEGSSNTKLKYNGGTYNSDQSDGESDTYRLSYTICDTLTFGLQAYNDWDAKNKMLNKLTLTIGGSEYAVNVPTRQGGSATTTLTDGTTVFVQNTDGRAYQGWDVQYPSYSVTITAPEGQKLSGDIHVVTNCKNRGDKEIWVTQLTGVDPLGTSNVKLVSDDGDNKLSAGSGEFGQFNSSTATFYIAIQAGFDDTVAPKVTVIVDGQETAADLTKANRSGYDYQFSISKSSGDDFRIIVEAQPLEQVYGVKYLSDSAVVDTQNNLVFGSNFNVGRGVEVGKDGFVLDGWKLVGDDSTLYRGDATFAINDSTEDYANFDSTDGIWYFEFEAQWISESDAKEAPYQLEVYIDEGEDYGENPVYSVTEYGVLGYSAVVDEDSLIERLSGRDGIPENLAEYYELDTDSSNLSEEIKADGTSVVKVHFKRATGTIAFEENGGTEV